MRYRSVSAILGIIFLIHTCVPGPLLSKNLQTSSKEEIVIKIPRSLGKITSASSSTKDRIVYLIEDIHAQPQAQKNIYRILKLISQTYSKPLRILVEGSSKKIDLEPIRNMPSREAIEIVSQDYLANGTLSGEEFYAIHSEIPPNLQGAEVESSYQENLAIYRNFKKRESSILSSLSELEKFQDEKTKKFLNSELQTIIHKRKNYQRDQLNVTEYSQFLLEKAQQKKISIQHYPNLKILSKAFIIEKSEDLKGIDQQIQKALQEISKVAQKKDLQRLVKQTLEAQLYENKTSKYLELLQELAKSYSISSIESDRLKSYQSYASLLEKGDARKIPKEEKMLFKELGEKSCQSEEEEKLFKSLFYFESLKNVLTLKASPEDYQDSVKAFSLELKNLLSTIKKEFPVLDQGLKISLKFYDSALERNHHLAHTLIHQTKYDEPSVLILGGFHTQAVQDLIGKEGIQTHIVTPQFSLENDPTNYERMLLGRHTPLGKLLTQEFSTLRQPPIPDRSGDFLLLQLDVLETTISIYTDSADIRDFLQKSIEVARLHQTYSSELLDQLQVKKGPGKSLILLGKNLALIVQPTNGKNSFWTSLNLSPQGILREKEKGAWSFQFIKISGRLKSRLEKLEAAPPQIQITFEGIVSDERIRKFLLQPEFFKKVLKPLSDQLLNIHVQYHGVSPHKKGLYKANVFDSEGRILRSIMLKTYDPEIFQNNKQSILESWQRWNEMSRLDSDGHYLARNLAYSEEEGIFAQEWIDGRTLGDDFEESRTSQNSDILKKALRKAINNALRLYVLSGRKILPWDYQPSNIIEGRFVDEEDISLNPSAHEIIDHLRLLSYYLQSFYKGQPTKEYEFLFEATLDAFEKASSREEGLNFLYEAYAADKNADIQRLDKEGVFSKFLLKEFFGLEAAEPRTSSLSLAAIESRLSQFIQHDPQPEYRRELMQARPLKPGQVSLYLGMDPAPHLAIADSLAGLRVYGIDINPATLQDARDLAHFWLKFSSLQGFSPPKLFDFNAENLDEAHGFTVNSVDHINMQELFGGSFKGNTTKIIQNVILLLKEGGTLLITNNLVGEQKNNPTELELFKRVSDESETWDLEWDIDSLGIMDQYRNRIYLMTLKKKSKKPSQKEQTESFSSQVQIKFEKTPRNDRVWRFLSNPEFFKQIGQISLPSMIKVEFKGRSNQGKRIYRADVYGSDGQKVKSLALKVYDQNTFEANRERIVQSWDRWNEMSKLDSEGRSLSRSLDYSEEEAIFAQEWVDGQSLDQAITKAITARDISSLKFILREAIQNAVRLYILSDQKYIPWDYLSSNVIEGRFVDEDEVPLNPKADEVVSYLSLFSRNLQMFRSLISEEEEYEFLWRAILDIFEKESTREKGLDFLYEAYHLALSDEDHRLLDPELNFTNFLLREYMDLTVKDPKAHLIIDEIEKRISLGPKTVDYQRKLILERPLRRGQISLHIGIHPLAVFPVAETMSGLRVFGIDKSDISVKSPQRKIKTKFGDLVQEGFSPPKFFKLNAEDLDEAHGFSANSVDHITMKQLFGGMSFDAEIEKSEKIVRNIIHLIREGGTVLLTDVHLNENPRNPTEVQILKIVSEQSEEWNLEWDIQPLGIKDHYESNIFLATLKKKTKKAARVKLERTFATIWNILERYSNVHRGLGQHSQVSTHLFERARYWIGEKLGIDSKKQVVILATSPTLAIESLAHNLRLEPEDHIITDSKHPPHFLNLRSTLMPIKEDLKIDLEALESYLKRIPTKLISIQNPRSLGLTPENISNLSQIVHENGARILVDASGWPIDQINAKSLGIDYLIFEGSRVSPFAPTVILAALDLLKTGADEPPYETGGGTKEIARLDKVVWGKAPEKFEVGSPNIVGAILLATLLKNPEGLPSLKMPNLPHRNGYHSIKALENALIGKDAKVPTHHGETTYINFDNAASTPTFIPVLETIKEYIQSMPTRRIIMRAHAFEKILKYFGAPEREYDILTFRNTSEAINYLAYQMRLSSNAVVVNSLLEHNSNELPWRGKNLIRLNVDENGFMDLAHLEKLLIEYNKAQSHANQRIELVAISGASNVLGTVNDLAEISKLVHRYGAKLMVDAAQLAAHRKIDIQALDIDFLVYSSHKIYAPFGHGGLIFRNDLLKASYGEESSPEGMIALSKMMDILTKIGLDHVAEHEEELLRYSLEKFKALEKIQGVKIKIHGIKDPLSPLLSQKTGVISFNIRIPDVVLPKNLKGKTYLPYNLVSAVLAEEGGIGVRAGCFCADLLLQSILEISDEETARLEEELLKGDRSNLPGTTRMSFGIYNTKEEIDRFFEILANLVQGKYDLSKYQLYKKSGEYYTVDHLQAMEKFLVQIEETIFGPKIKESITDPHQEFLNFIEKVRSKRDTLLSEGRDLLDDYLQALENGQTIMFRDFYQTYLKVKEVFSSLPYQFALWILNDFSPSSGKHHIVFIQRGSNTLGNLIKDLSRKLDWTHLKFHDLYINQKLAGFDRNEILDAKNLSAAKMKGENTPEEIFQYLLQEGLLDGTPILFIDTGILGSNPLFLRRLIQDPQQWKNQGMDYRKIEMSTRLFFFDAWPDEKEIRAAHEDQIKGFNDALNVNNESLDWYKIAYFLDKGARHLYERPLRLIWKDGPDGKKIAPELLPSDAWTQLLSLVQTLPFEDSIQEKITENDPSLQNLKAVSDTPKSDTEMIILSDQFIEGISTQILPKAKKIAVIEQTENDATAYAGNLIQRLEKENEIQRFSLKDLEFLADFTNFLKKFRPDFVLLPQGRSDLEAMIQDVVDETGRELTILSYVSLDLFPFQNFFFPFSDETAQIVKKAIQAHKSQVSRTAYDQIFDYSSQAAGQKLQLYSPSMKDVAHAQAFRVGFIKNGEITITSNEERYKIGSKGESSSVNFDGDIPLLVISPHADDLEIAAGGFIRSILEEKGPSRTRVLNWVIGTGDEWGVIFEPDHPAADLSEEAQIGIKRSIRREEAFEAGSTLSKDTPGKLEVSVFGLLSASQHPQSPHAILPMNDPQVFHDLRYVQRKLDFLFDDYFDSFKVGGTLTVILPHPEDAHPHHQMATKIVLEALNQLTIAHGITIQLLFYSSPWAGSFNTYYVSKENQTLDEMVSSDLKGKIFIAEKVKRSLGIIIGELFAGFGKKPLSPEELGGPFAERFMRKTIRPSTSQVKLGLPPAASETLEFDSSKRIFESAA